MEQIQKHSDEITNNLNEICEKIKQAALSVGRDPTEVTLMAVTKTVEPERVNMAIDYGVKLLGENRAQELCEKFDSYDKENVQIHFIGHLQTNKVKQIIDKVTMIHSVDSLRLAEEISRLAETRLKKQMDILIEVNIGDEASKSGIEYQKAEALIREISALQGVKIRGLMCIPPICTEKSELDSYFTKMQLLFVDIKDKKIDNVSMEFLSMGMSGDYEAAIRHGANIVRIGSSIFGKRDYPQKPMA